MILTPQKTTLQISLYEILIEGPVAWECGKVILAKASRSDKVHLPGNPQQPQNKVFGANSQRVEVQVLEQIEPPVNQLDNLNIVECLTLITNQERPLVVVASLTIQEALLCQELIRWIMEELQILLDIIQWLQEGQNRIHVDLVAYTIVQEPAGPLPHRSLYIKRGNHPIIQIPVTIGEWKEMMRNSLVWWHTQRQRKLRYQIDEKK